MGSAHDKKHVNIQLHSSIQHPGQPKDIVKQKVTGQQIVKNGASYIQYEEEHDGQTIQSTIKLGHDEALIMRSGAVKMRLPLAVGETRNGQYKNEHMALPLVVKTKKLRFEEQGQLGSFTVHYELHADGSLLGKYELSITYTEGQQ